MSLDIWLTNGSAEFLIAADMLDERGFAAAANHLRQQAGKTVFEANITHNLSSMANAAGIHQAIWFPETLGITEAGQLIKPLQAGLARLRSDRDHFRQFNPTVGWGSLDGFTAWVDTYLQACVDNPDALVSVSR